MPRHLSPLRIVPALAFLALAILVLAASPVLAVKAEAHSHGWAAAMSMEAAAGPCADMAGGAHHSYGKHAGDCLAKCLASHGAVLPDLPLPEGSWLSPAARPYLPAVHAWKACPSGLDPPPPRAS